MVFSYVDIIEVLKTENQMPKKNQPKNQYNFYGKVGSVNPENQGHITQHINQQDLQKHLGPFQQLVEAGQNEGFITQKEYDDLMLALKELQSGETPSEERKSLLRRGLGKIREFAGKRLEKGVDTVVTEEAKQWVADGGLDLLTNVFSG